MAEPGKLSNFELLEPLGRGGMGVIHRAIQRSLGRPVAIKRMHAHLAESPEFLERFEREARTAASLDHPNVVRVIDFGREGNECFLAMELVDGTDLRALLRAHGPLPLGVGLSVGLDLLRALECAHSAGVIHRDVKPANVLIARDGTAKLADFSIARAGDVGSITQPGTAVGTPSYMSPEQASGGTVGPPSDVFSAAVVLYQTLGGRKPFDGESYPEMLRQLMTTTPPALVAVSSAIPEPIAEVVDRALKRDPAKRPADGAAFRRELEDAIARAGFRVSREDVAAFVKLQLAATPPPLPTLPVRDASSGSFPTRSVGTGSVVPLDVSAARLGAPPTALTPPPPIGALPAPAPAPPRITRREAILGALAFALFLIALPWRSWLHPASVANGGGGSTAGSMPTPIVSTGNPFSFVLPRDRWLSCSGIAGRAPDRCGQIADPTQKLLCAALASKKPEPCDELPDTDRRAFCRGLASQDESSCGSIQDAGLKSFCLAVATPDANLCQAGDRDTLLLCYAMATHIPSNCRDIHGPDDRAFCVAVSHSDDVLCGTMTR